LKGLENNESIDKIVDGEEDKSDTKVYRALKKLESAFNPHAKKAIDDYNHGREISLEQVNFALFTTNVIKEPSSCKEAINYAEKKVRFALKEAIDKELNEMTKRGAWKVIDEKDIPKDRQCIKNKWIFKIKRKGIFAQDLWHAVIAKIPESILVRALHLFSMT
jgi:hypothetical protein